MSGACGRAAIWNISELVPVGDPFPHTTDFCQAAVANQARLLATTTDAGFVLWTPDAYTWSAIACCAAGRNIGAQEWIDFPTEAHRQICDEWPLVKSAAR